MGKAQLEELEKHGRYFSVPRGISMWPMIENKQGVVEVEKLTQKAKRYDLVMYIRPNCQGVIHRVVRVYDDHYIIVGDNCWQKEYVKTEQVKGIVVRFYRKGKWYDVNNKWYRLYVHLWVDLLFLKRPVFYIRDKIKHFVRKRHNEKK